VGNTWGEVEEPDAALPHRGSLNSVKELSLGWSMYILLDYILKSMNRNLNYINEGDLNANANILRTSVIAFTLPYFTCLKSVHLSSNLISFSVFAILYVRKRQQSCKWLRVGIGEHSYAEFDD